MAISISSALGNVSHTFQDNIQSTLTTVQSMIENTIGTITTGASHAWSGGFAGMSEGGMDELKTQIDKYCSDVEAQIAEFDENGDISNAIKGKELQAAVVEYVAACKALLQAYVSTIRQEIEEADGAYTNFMAASSSIASDISSDAEEIRSQASSIRID